MFAYYHLEAYLHGYGLSCTPNRPMTVITGSRKVQYDYSQPGNLNVHVG